MSDNLCVLWLNTGTMKLVRTTSLTIIYFLSAFTKNTGCIENAMPTRGDLLCKSKSEMWSENFWNDASLSRKINDEVSSSTRALKR